MTSAAVTSCWIVPSARRPHNARELTEAWENTAAGLSTALLLVVDDDDPDLDGYRQVSVDHPWIKLLEFEGSPHRIGPILNTVCRDLLDGKLGRVPDLIGFMGDDHRPRSLWWDRELATMLARWPGMAYGNDLFQQERLPTACLISSSVLAAYGGMVPEGLDHLGLDDFWLQLGHETHLAYRPDVIIEHVHPAAGKAAMDPGYAAKGMNPELMHADLGRLDSYWHSPHWAQARKRLADLLAPAAS